MYQTFLILYVCIVVPFRLGSDAKDNKAWVIINAFTDISFGVDMVLTFITAYVNTETGKLVDDHKQIAKNYLLSWFIVDLISIFPIEPIINALSKSQTLKINSLARIARISKLYKMARLFRLSKLGKILQKKKQRPSNLNTELKLREGKERLVFTALIFIFFIHITACLWLVTAQYKPDHNWLTLKKEKLLEDNENIKGDIQTYFVSVYFIT